MYLFVGSGAVPGMRKYMYMRPFGTRMHKVYARQIYRNFKARTRGRGFECALLAFRERCAAGRSYTVRRCAGRTALFLKQGVGGRR